MASNQNHITQTLRKLQENLYDLSARNPLVVVDPEKLWLVEKSEINAEKIYKRARFFENEYGLSTTLCVHLLIRWKRKSAKEFITSPLLWQTARIKETRREQIHYSLEITDETLVINPILRKLFTEEFNLELPVTIEKIEDLFETLTQEFKSLSLENDFSENESWQLISQKAVGIFNYKKMLSVRDFDQIIDSPTDSIIALLGESTRRKEESVRLPQDKTPFLDQLDHSQKTASISALRSHTVIQGPPGTGKSHTLVALIKTLLHQNKKVLFVSEKKSALEVVYERLRKEKLDLCVAYFDPSRDEKKLFYSQLKKSWELAHQPLEVTPVHHDQTETPVLDYYTTRYGTVDHSTGLSVRDILVELTKTQFTQDQLEYTGALPELSLWKKHQVGLQFLEENCRRLFKINTFDQAPFLLLNAALFSEDYPVQKLTDRIAKIHQALQPIIDLNATYKLANDLSGIFRFAIAASILVMVNKHQLNLIKPEEKKYKAFNAAAKKYQLLKSKLSQVEKLNAQWSQKPSVAEITELTDLLKQKQASQKPGKKSILGILKRNSAKAKNYFDDFSPELSSVAKLQLLENIRTEWHLIGELQALKIKLKHDFGVLNPDTDIDHILHVRSKLGNTTSTEYQTILEHEHADRLISELAALHSELNHAVNLLDYLLHRSVSRQFDSLQHTLQNLKSAAPRLQEIEGELKVFFKLPDSLLHLFRNKGVTVEKANAIILYRELNNQTRFEPAFKKLTSKQLQTEIQRQKKTWKNAANAAVVHIRDISKEAIRREEALVAKAPHKLAANQKKQRELYKVSKRLLLHELKKKQAHLPILELMQQGKELVLNLQPVWMMNPLSVTQFLPNDASYFDYVIFDEASQIPLEDAMPAAYRGAQLVIVGDSQQMPPGQFFSSNEHTITLLDQAEVTFKNAMLTGHYRSEHPDLIQFSNQQFYDNALKFLPPTSKKSPITLVSCEGVFEDQKNLIEAKAIAKQYAAFVKEKKTDVGIIAFSVEQATAIEKEILRLKLPENPSLLIRNLENVQGLERDYILISVGYAKNKDGVLIKNFGPINQERGANRLNVLLTRAVKHMTIFASFTSADLGLSANRGLTVLSQFLDYAAQANPTLKTAQLDALDQRIYHLLKKNRLDFDVYSYYANYATTAFVNHHSGHMILVDPFIAANGGILSSSTLEEFEKRFPHILIVLSTDLLNTPHEMEKSILDFLA